jgi:hypothetical protein
MREEKKRRMNGLGTLNVQLLPGNLFGFDETTVPVLVLSPSAEEGTTSSCDRCLAEPTPFGGRHLDALQVAPGHHVPSHGRRRPETLS